MAKTIKEMLGPPTGPRSTPYAMQILAFMNLMGLPMYEGTVPRHVKARRRAKNKVAKRSRKVNRRA